MKDSSEKESLSQIAITFKFKNTKRTINNSNLKKTQTNEISNSKVIASYLRCKNPRHEWKINKNKIFKSKKPRKERKLFEKKNPNRISRWLDEILVVLYLKV